MDLILPKASLSIIDCLLKPPLAHFYKTLPVYRLQRHDQAATSPLRSDRSLEWPAKHNQNTPFRVDHCPRFNQHLYTSLSLEAAATCSVLLSLKRPGVQ
jgi:hypothetical protein